ncbi:AbrB/MazE/SpoVT family DNA-binding domain-containing protein [Methylorubrum populi]|uniref:AbrB/MazE/SpoVT family DNA-binding domain-containing protein n=1 Tax=Methylorubrum rhodesianum TaxID=29427 RepID=UPI00190AEF94|nr:AbrB/MazE/SpoVT family DNA-binding domain-containing protein [Methylorubrum rhodesianum]MBK3403933.1 AbrB/MazE/SpoVT family DNA-binding domain-containing protein [Methylorubrum rhodesianum]MBY0140036.1 AbrB/MazE/SpoVT family DNA-binding domain-containing protein [Methylorubrum populi]
MGDVTARVRLVRTQDGQRLDIPPRFMLSGDEAVLHAEGNRLVVEAVAPVALLSVLSGLEDIDEDWPEIEDAQPDDVRL